MHFSLGVHAVLSVLELFTFSNLAVFVSLNDSANTQFMHTIIALLYPQMHVFTIPIRQKTCVMHTVFFSTSITNGQAKTHYRKCGIMCCNITHLTVNIYKRQSWLQLTTNFVTSNKECYFTRIICQQTILVKYHALIVIFEKEAQFEIVVCCIL